MQLKIAAMAFAALLITVVVAMKLFAPEDTTLKSVDSRLQALEDRLRRLENKVAGTERGPLSSRPLLGPSSAGKATSNLPVVDGGLPSPKAAGKPPEAERTPLVAKPAPAPTKLEDQLTGPSLPTAPLPTDEPIPSAQPHPKGSMQALDSFFSALPAEKHSQAEGIFQAHLETLRFKLDDAAKQGSSPQELNTLIYNDQLQIREEMKQILSDQEYKTFMDALPLIPKP